MQGKVLAVCTSERKGQRKINIGRGKFVSGLGLDGDAHAGSERRHVSFLAMESINKAIQKGLAVRPGDFAENITTIGLNLPSLPIGTKLKIGCALLEISQIGKECPTRCSVYYQNGDCIMPREGVFAVVLSGGPVAIGDIIEVDTND
jgi:MOSC domain-containing protein YiiM